MPRNAGAIDDVLGAELARTIGLSEEITRLADQLNRLQAAGDAASERARTSSRQATGGTGLNGSEGRALLDVVAGGLGLSPLFAGLAGLFGKGSDSSSGSVIGLPRFSLPSSIQVNGGIREMAGQTFAVDTPQGGISRAVPAEPPPAQITVQVQAMDSQSFLDHSAEIALAVRRAMLESSVLNDVVREA